MVPVWKLSLLSPPYGHSLSHIFINLGGITMLKHINTAAEFDAEIKEGTVLVDFFATWCGPCKMLSPVLEEVAQENPNINVLKIDVDEVGELAARYGIQAIPTLMLFKNGQRVETRMGYQNKNQLVAFINQ